ncbi:hypothetical protein HanRHA438_Chr11g0531151 [Helianthus annuus]|nr:hypothetical protein HanRHA438_Chr11g0531151 [Helianthus annuus]
MSENHPRFFSTFPSPENYLSMLLLLFGEDKDGAIGDLLQLLISNDGGDWW